MTPIDHRIASRRHVSPHSSTALVVTCACGWTFTGSTDKEAEIHEAHERHRADVIRPK